MSPTYPLVPTSLRNPEIILHLRLFQEQRGLPELPPSHMPEPREYELDGTWGLIDLSWSQRAPQMVTDDIDRNPRYSQYPYQEADDYEEEEEEMEVDEWVQGKTGSACMAAPTSTQCSYHHPEATYAFPRQDQTPGSPRSIHTDTDMAMEMGGLGMGTSRSETHRVMPRMEDLARSDKNARFGEQPHQRYDRGCYPNPGSSPIHRRWMMWWMLLSRSVSNKEELRPHKWYQQEWNLPPAGSLHSTDLDTGRKLPGRKKNGNQDLKWLPEKFIGDVNPAIRPAQSPLTLLARRGGASLGLEMRENPRKAVRRMKVGVAKYKSGLTGPLRVSRNLFPSQIRSTRLSNLTHLGLVKTNNPEWSLQ